MRQIAFVLFLVLACSRLFAAAQPGSSSPLPDAPAPAPGILQQKTSAPGSTPPSPTLHYAPLYARTIFPGETPRHLTVWNKFIYSGRQMVEPINLLPTLFSSAEGQLRNSDPKYGTDSGAFGQRFGAALIREDSDRLFTNAVFPSLLHQDPRFYRQGTGTNMSRIESALEQMFVARSDSGKQEPNYSGLIGRALAAGLSQAYYPDTSRGGGVVLREFGDSMGGLAALNLLREFVPREVFTHLTIFRHSGDAGQQP